MELINCKVVEPAWMEAKWIMIQCLNEGCKGCRLEGTAMCSAKEH